MRDWIVGLIGAAVIIAAALLISAWPAHAQTPACITTAAIGTYYGKDDATAFQFDAAADVAKITGILSHIAGSPPDGTPVLIIMGFDLPKMSADFFLFGGDGCNIDVYGGMPINDATSLMQALGIALPTPVAIHKKGLSI